jgi:hypothetical protein
VGSLPGWPMAGRPLVHREGPPGSPSAPVDEHRCAPTGSVGSIGVGPRGATAAQSTGRQGDRRGRPLGCAGWARLRKMQWQRQPAIGGSRSMGAALHRTITDHSGQQRSAGRAGQHTFPRVFRGRPMTQIVSRTEEVAWASVRAGTVPQRARAGSGGHQRSHGLKQQAARLPAPAIGCRKPQISLRPLRSLIGKFRGSAAENRRRREPTYFCGIPLQTGPSHPRRTRQTCSIAHTNQTKKPRSHPSLRGVADWTRLQPF